MISNVAKIANNRPKIWTRGNRSRISVSSDETLFCSSIREDNVVSSLKGSHYTHVMLREFLILSSIDHKFDVLAGDFRVYYLCTIHRVLSDAV